MKTEWLVAMLAMAGAGICAAQAGATQKATVIVCMNPDQNVLMNVRPMASQVFASIGVRIDWRERDSCPVGSGAIQVRLSHDSPWIGDPEVLAFARLYAGTIVVFLDRVQRLPSNVVRSMMAYVLVHEITHVLEGISRHSATGIMKARWNSNDYFEMRHEPLRFAQKDVDLIYDGIKVRHARMAREAGVTRAPIAGPVKDSVLLRGH